MNGHAQFQLFLNGRTAGHHEIARAAARDLVKRTQLAPAEVDLAALRHEQALPGELLLDAHGALGRVRTHLSRLIEAQCDVSRALSNRDGSGDNQRRIDRERHGRLELRMHAAVVESHGDGSASLEHGKVSWPADGDIAAFGQIDLRLSRSHRDVAAAGEHRGTATVFDVHAYRPGYRDVVSSKPPDNFKRTPARSTRGLRAQKRSTIKDK